MKHLIVVPFLQLLADITYEVTKHLQMSYLLI